MNLERSRRQKSRINPLRRLTGWKCVLTAEHASAAVPKHWQYLFRGQSSVLKSHRGWDPGTVDLARFLHRRLGWPLVEASWTRLLVELNRSLHHPRLFSEFTRDLPALQKRELIDNYYLPHRFQVEQMIAQLINSGWGVVHVGVHSFTPVLDDKPRRADVGLLYDPGRKLESQFCRKWQKRIQLAHPDWVVRRNYPYLGRADGLTTALRQVFPENAYLGIELEVNQKWFEQRSDCQMIERAVAETLSSEF